MNAEPFEGNLDENSAYIYALQQLVKPAKMNDKNKLGPANWTASPVSAKIPAPMIEPTPYIVK
jgi:hypothetical protein